MDGEEFAFPSGSATASTYLYVACESPGFTSFFGSAPDDTPSAADISGDDAIERFELGQGYLLSAPCRWGSSSPSWRCPADHCAVLEV